MAKPEIRIEGLDQLRRDLRKIADVDLNVALVGANRELAKAIVDLALPNVPVQTGRLKASVRGLGNLAGAVGKAGNAQVPYAAAIHWGRSTGNTNFKSGKHSKGQGSMQARPFLQDAAKQIEATVVERYTERILPVFDAVNSQSSGR